MAEKIEQNISTFEIPAEKDEDWHDDIDVEYATYGNEKDYISPKKISEKNIKKIKAIEEKLKSNSITLFDMNSKLTS